MCTSKLYGAVCAGALLLSAGCTTNTQSFDYPENGEAVTAAERNPLAVLDDRVGHVLAVTFAFDRDTLDQKATALLDAQAAWMAERPELEFTVTGHADRVGNPTYNLELGRRRAERVVAYLVDAGIERDRLEALVSHGEMQPLVDTEDPERLNRRVVIELAGVIKTTSAPDAGPWWRHKPSPHPINWKDGPNGSPGTRTTSDTAPRGTFSNPDTTSNETPSGSSGAPQTTSTSTSGPSGSGGTTGSTDSGSGTKTAGSGSNSGPSTGGSETGSGSTSGSTGSGGSSTGGSGTGSSGSSGSTGSDSGGAGSGGDQGSTGSSKDKGNKGKGKGKGSGGKPSKSNPSNDRLDAGGGNGIENGDPGQSGNHNQAKEDD